MSEWTRPCACGGEVRANPDDPAPGVRMHQQTIKHVRYRQVMEGTISPTAAAARERRAKLRAEVEAARARRSVA